MVKIQLVIPLHTGFNSHLYILFQNKKIYVNPFPHFKPLINIEITFEVGYFLKAHQDRG